MNLDEFGSMRNVQPLKLQKKSFIAIASVDLVVKKVKKVTAAVRIFAIAAEDAVSGVENL